MRIQPSSPPPSPAPQPVPEHILDESSSTNRPGTIFPDTSEPSPPTTPPALTPSAPTPYNPLTDRVKSSHPILWSLSNKQRDQDEPDDAKTHRSVGVDPDFYDMVDDNIISIIIDACKPLFDLVSEGGDSPDSKATSMKHADLVMTTAKLIIAAGYKMKEQARQEMAEEDLGGGMFDQDVRGMREFAAKVPLPQVYDADEMMVLDTQLALHEAPGKGLKKYMTGTKLYTCQLADTGSGVDVRAEMEVRAPVEQVLGYYMGHVTQYNKHMTGKDDIDIVLGERSSDHSLFAMGEIPLPDPFNNRELVTRILWKKLDENTIFCVSASCKHDEFPRRAGLVRMEFRRSYKLTKIGPKLTKVEGSCSMGMGGVIPRRINDSVTIPVVVSTLKEVLTYFASVRPADSFDDGDGTVLGRLMFLQLHPLRKNRDRLNQKILDVIRMTNVLRSAQAKYRFFDEFLFHIIRNAMKKGAVQTKFTVKTRLVALTANEAGRIARSLVSIMMANSTAVAAVDEHIMTFPALGELDREYRWFRPMMEAIAAELMNQVAYGVKVRAAIGAAASFGDMISDAYMVHVYDATGRSGPAYALLGMVGGNLGAQLLIVYAQTNGLKKDKWRTMFFEFLSVISFVKPGVDAYRVASGAESAAGAAFEPLQEMVFTKGGELVFEAVPGLVVQLVAALTAEKNPTSAYVSLFISTASAALTATSMFWDMDTDPGKRKADPAWMGMIPDLGRGTAFATVFAMSAFQIFAKATGTALLAVTNPAWLWYYILGDHGLHFAYRIARRDFVFFTPLPVVASYAVAPLVRVTTKVLGDFTGLLVCRLPLLSGGSYFAWSLASSQVSVFAGVYLYLEHAPGEGADKVAAGTLWAGAATLAVAWLITWIFFVFRIAVPKYRHTLWSWTSGRQLVHDYFYKGKDDEAMFTEIFSMNLLLWESDIGDEVKAWTAENWARWKEESPPWFKIENVPDQFVPAVEMEQLGHNRKRRGSAAGSVRESFREEVM